MFKVIMFVLIAALACDVVDYWVVIGPIFLQKCFYAQAWSLVWHDALGSQVIRAMSILSYSIIKSA